MEEKKKHQCFWPGISCQCTGSDTHRCLEAGKARRPKERQTWDKGFCKMAKISKVGVGGGVLVPWLG